MPQQVVPLAPADLPALLDLCAAALPLDTFSLPLLRHRVFDDPRYDAQFSLGTRAGPDRRLSAAVVGVSLWSMADYLAGAWPAIRAIARRRAT